jgi:hypothetical protein
MALASGRKRTGRPGWPLPAERGCPRKNYGTPQILIGLSGKTWLTNSFCVVRSCFVGLQEIRRMSKSRDTRKDKKKQPQKTLKEKRQAKREKKNT